MYRSIDVPIGATTKLAGMGPESLYKASMHLATSDQGLGTYLFGDREGARDTPGAYLRYPH